VGFERFKRVEAAGKLAFRKQRMNFAVANGVERNGLFAAFEPGDEVVPLNLAAQRPVA